VEDVFGDFAIRAFIYSLDPLILMHMHIKFMERTPGSFIEERAASIVWRFWTGPIDDSADRQWALRQIAKAQNHIFDSFGERYGLRMIPVRAAFWCCQIISRDRVWSSLKRL
jgi:hypothetical protein